MFVGLAGGKLGCRLFLLFTFGAWAGSVAAQDALTPPARFKVVGSKLA
jgi:hypothetical protein